MDVESFYGMCRAYTHKIMPNSDAELREDIVQEAMLMLLEGESKLGYTRGVRHVVVDAVRKILWDSRSKCHSKEIPMDWLNNTFHAVAPSYEDEYMFYEWLLSQFKGTGKDIAKLMLAGYEIKEIAQIYGCSIANVLQVLNYNTVKEKKRH